MNIHPTAIVDSGAVIGEGTRVGPFSVVGPNVVLGKNCDVQEHVVLRGHTEIGDESRIFPGAVVGAEPQHLGYRGEPTRVEIGRGVTLRECVTIHRGTAFGLGTTRVGDHSLIMAYSHVAHDCTVGKNVIIANGTQLAGHAEVHDFAVVGGMCAIIQYCRVGRYTYVGGASVIRKDLPPFVSGKGGEFRAQAINSVGLARRGFSDESVARLKKVFKIFYLQKGTVAQALDRIQTELGMADEVKVFVDFVKESKVGIERH